jgi:hypothetical protein
MLIKPFAHALGVLLLLWSTSSFADPVAHPQALMNQSELGNLRDARFSTHAFLRPDLEAYVTNNRSALTVMNARDLGGYALAASLVNNSDALNDAAERLGVLCSKSVANPGSSASQTLVLDPDENEMTAAYNLEPWIDDCDLAQSRGLQGISIAYDFLFSRLPETDAKLCRERIIHAAKLFVDVLNGDTTRCQPTELVCSASGSCTPQNGTWTWKNAPSNNHHWVNHAALGVAALVMENEKDTDDSSPLPTADWLSRAEAGMLQMKSVLDLSDDGTWHEGIGYQAFGIERTLYYSLGAKRRSMLYATDKNNMVQKIGQYILSVQQPDHPKQFVMTNADANWVRPDLVSVLAWGATRFRDANAREAIRRWNAGTRTDWLRKTWGGAYALEYIIYDPAFDFPVFSADALPRDVYNSEQESFVMRSSWAEGSSDNLVVAFKSGNVAGRKLRELVINSPPSSLELDIGHDHEDDLSLWIYGKGGWQLPEATAYNCCNPNMEFHTTKWHNSFLIDGLGQLGDRKTLNSGDDKKGIPYGPSARQWFKDRQGSMPLHVSTTHYAFARGDGKLLYPSSLNLDHLWRTVGFSREDHGFIALQDRIGFTSAAAAKTVQQVFHMMKANPTPDNGASVDTAPWILLDNRVDTASKINASSTTLGIRVVAPASYHVDFGRQDSNKYTEWYHPNGRYGQALVRPAANSKDVTFLQMLWPTTYPQWGSRPDVQPLETTSVEAGFSVQLPSGKEHWMYNITGTTTSAGGFKLMGSRVDDIAVVRWGTGCSDLKRLVVVGAASLYHKCGGADPTQLLLDAVAAPSNGAIEVAFTGTRADISGLGSGVTLRFRGPAITEVWANNVQLPFTRDGDIVSVGFPDGTCPGPYELTLKCYNQRVNDSQCPFLERVPQPKTCYETCQVQTGTRSDNFITPLEKTLVGEQTVCQCDDWRCEAPICWSEYTFSYEPPSCEDAALRHAMDLGAWSSELNNWSYTVNRTIPVNQYDIACDYTVNDIPVYDQVSDNRCPERQCRADEYTYENHYKTCRLPAFGQAAAGSCGSGAGPLYSAPGRTVDQLKQEPTVINAWKALNVAEFPVEFENTRCLPP